MTDQAASVPGRVAVRKLVENAPAPTRTDIHPHQSLQWLRWLRGREYPVATGDTSFIPGDISHFLNNALDA
jgi:hypothetical protein